jgi:CRP-like cAMP-binding protein
MLENQLLQTLCVSRPDLSNRLQPIDFVHGDVLAECGAPIRRAIFPRSGLISVVVGLHEGDRIEVAMVGPGGALGGGVIFGATHHLGSSFAQIPGRAWAMRAEDLFDAADACAQFRNLMFGQEQYLLAQAQQTAACNAKHTILQRLSSWLLRAHEASGGGLLMLTQENLAQMLGVQRASVSVFAGQLQEQDLIEYRRGRVRIKDAAGLARQACECCTALRHKEDSLTGARLCQRQSEEARSSSTATSEVAANIA